MGIHLLSPVEADMVMTTAAGLCTLIILTRKFGWAAIVSSLLVTELAIVFFIVPFLMLRAWSQPSYRPTAFLWGFGGTYVLSALVTLLEKLRDDPQGTISWLRGLREGNNQGGER